jgi:CheY-like chemotaxis protein
MTRVLLVDDDVNLREALEAAMVAAGHDVTVANNGLEALTTAVTASPQVIVTDMNMPVLEGPDMVRMLRAVPRLSRVPVILMSGVDIEAGIPVERHLRKPFDPTTLLDSVSGVAAGAADPSGEEKDRSCGRPAVREKTDPTQDHTQDLVTNHPHERFASRTPVPRAQKSAGTDEVSKHICRGLELVYEQEARMQMLRGLGIDVRLAQQLHDALVSSVAALSGLDRSGGMTTLLASLHDPHAACNWMESCVRECSRMHTLGNLLERPMRVAQATPVSRARKRC